MTPDQRRIVRQAADSAIVRLWDSLVPLRSVNTFMQTGAHPDDETTRLLVRLAKGDGARVAYACCVRGEGGQNSIGTEFRTTLGVLRTREMEAAADVLGMELYWLNEEYEGTIFDFGFSKSAQETFTLWGREHTLERLVRAIRACRPDVIAPTFLDVDGQHGHHRANTVATIEAFELAADPDAFPQHAKAGLQPWQTKKLYLPAWSGAGGSYDDEVPPPNATISIDVGGFDPVHGATYAQMAQWSRACHRTQGMGHWVEPGPDSVPLHRLDCVLDLPLEEAGVFDGLPQNVGELADICVDGEVAIALRGTQSGIEAAFVAFPDNRGVARALHKSLTALRAARSKIDRLEPLLRDDLKHRLAIKEEQLCRASAAACLLVPALQVSNETLVPGETFVTVVSVYNGGPIELSEVDLSLDLAPGLATPAAARRQQQLRPGMTARAEFEIRLDASTPTHFPYRFHGRPTVSDDPVSGRVSYVADGVRIVVPVSPEQTIAVLPPMSFEITPNRVVLNLARPVEPFDTKVKVVSNAANKTGATLGLQLPEGWQADPAAHDLALPMRGMVAAADFRVSPPTNLAPGRTMLQLRDGAGNLGEHVDRIEHTHIRRTYRITPADIQVLAVEVRLPEIRVGYVGAGADRVDHWLQELGVAVDRLDADDLTVGDLQRYDTLLVGVFAFGMRPDLLAAAGRLHEYVVAGGNLVTLYHRPWDNWNPTVVPPRFLKVGQPSLRWRITDNAAEVDTLVPDHPLLNTPNKIGSGDWAGWVKERGLYFAAAWADDYVPLLAMSDPGEAPLKGALLSADIGRGRHVHTALILHYQLEFLVPGAFRLLANLITPARRENA